MVPADSRKIPRVPRYSGCHYDENLCPYGTVTRFGRPFQTVPVRFFANVVVLLPQGCLDTLGLGSSAFARHYLRNHCCFLLLEVMRCFSSLRLPPRTWVMRLQRTGLPHSDIRGSTDICSSPRLFAAYHVLPRLLEPRHPPSALLRFFISRL